MISTLIALALACTEPDGGTCQQQVNVGPYNEIMPWAGGGGYGQYTTYLWQSPTSPGVGCAFFTKYISVCSGFARSGYNAPPAGNGNGGALTLYNGSHRSLQWSDWSDFSPDAPDFAELGAANYEWKRARAYEYVASPRTLTCSSGSGVCVSETMPRGSNIRFDCQSDTGCEWRPGHSYLGNVWEYPIDGVQVCVRNVSSYSLSVLDRPDAGVDLDGDFVGGRRSSLCIEYVAGSWLELSRSFP